MERSSKKRAHVILPVDKLADKSEVARDEIQRREQRNALRAAQGAWKDEDHPELNDGAAAWVRRMRSESEKR